MAWPWVGFTAFVALMNLLSILQALCRVLAAQVVQILERLIEQPFAGDIARAVGRDILQEKGLLLAGSPVSGVTEAALGHCQAQTIAAGATQASVAFHGVEAHGGPLHFGIGHLNIRGRAVVPSGG